MIDKKSDWEPLPDSRSNLSYVFFAVVVAAAITLADHFLGGLMSEQKRRQTVSDLFELQHPDGGGNTVFRWRTPGCIGCDIGRICAEKRQAEHALCDRSCILVSEPMPTRQAAAPDYRRRREHRHPRTSQE